MSGAALTIFLPLVFIEMVFLVVLHTLASGVGGGVFLVWLDGHRMSPLSQQTEVHDSELAPLTTRNGHMGTDWQSK